jgi:RHS repeat-associated protein
MTHNYKHLKLSILFSILTAVVWAQTTPQPNYILQNNESGAAKTYVAWDFVSLKPGFKFAATSGTAFNAKIQAGIPTTPTSNTYAKSDGTITTDPTQGGIVGSIPGQINVGASGAASYSIPIDCPAGINGMQPNISLVYNSQGGNGPLGMGWGISGLSSISKTMKTIFSDNAILGIDKKNDAFMLDGSKLFIKTPGTTTSYKIGDISAYLDPSMYEDYFDGFGDWSTITGPTYETQNKTYSKIETSGLIPNLGISYPTGKTTHWKLQSSNPRYFKVTTKDGRIIEYTAIKNSVIITSDDNISYEWFVSKITDANGNFMTFTYQSSSGGQTVIQKIEYTGNGSKLPFYSMVFNYDTKTIVKSTIYGNESKEDKYLLKNIQIVSNSTVLKQYDLSYGYRKEKYYLETLSLTGQSSQKLRSTTFAWGTDNDLININTTAAPEPYSQQTVAKSDRYWLSADVNGDGTDEVINIYPAKIPDIGGATLTNDYMQVFKPSVSNGQISLTTDVAYDLGTGLSYANIKSTAPSVLIGDIYGDGKKKVIIPKLNLTGGAKVQFQVAGGVTYERPLKYSSQLPVCVVADINNDGIDEIIYLEKGKDSNSEYVYGEICYTKTDNTKTWGGIYAHVGLGTTYLPVSIIPVDVDNDGLKDLIVTCTTGFVYNHNTGNPSNTLDYNPVNFIDGGSLNFSLNGALKTIKTGDFDGDGMSDFLTNAQGSNSWGVQLGNGTTFSNISVSTGYNAISNEDCIVTDFNHDGKSDVILANRFYTTTGVFVQTLVSWYASTGTGFTVAKTFTSTDAAYSFNKYNCTGDFDGDGREDVLSYGSDIYNGGNKSDNVFIQRAFNNNFEANQIKTITDGLGKTTQLTYQPLTYTTADNRSFYTKGSGSVYPVADIQAPLYCVSKISEPNGQGGLKTTEFAYSGARAQLTGRGFLGFKTQTISNATTNRKIVTSTDMNMAYYLPDKETTEVSTLGGTAVSKTENYYANSKTGSIFLSQPTQTVESDYLNDLTKTTNYVSFDAYGNATSVKTTQGDLVTTQNSTYVQKGSWCPNKPETVSVTRQQDGNTYTRSKSYTYDDKGNLTKETTDPGDANQLTVEYKNWNAFGQPTTIETTANGILRTASIGFTPSGRFIQTKTDVLGQTTTYNWDETRGLLNSETNRIGTTTYTYNGMGQLSNTAYPDGTHKSQTAQWASADNAFGATFYVYQEASGAAPIYTWYDALQHEVVREAYKLNGKKSRVFTQYRADGKTDRVSAPTFGSQATAWDAVYDYYPEGRLKTVATSVGTTTTTYSGRTTTVTSPEGTQATALNTAGQTATSTVNGKTVTYGYYASGKAKTTTPDGSPAVAMEYDLQGNRTKLTDPDAGVSTAGYNGYGELKWEKQTNNATQGEITTNYNYNAATGQIESRVRNGETTSYGYDAYKRLGTVEIAGQNKQTYTYGDYDRVAKLTELIGSKSFDKQMAYDSYGRVSQVTYPSGYYTVNNYDSYGNLAEVTDKSGRSVWKATEANARGQLTRVSKGAKETVYGYDDSKGQLTSMAAAGVVSYSYSYDAKNNLEYRSDNLLGQKDHFSYDTQNRLTNWDIMNSANTVLKPNSMTYDGTTGNIAAKSDLGNFMMNYGESNGKPHALTTIMGKPDAVSASDLNVTYTDFRKIKTLTEADKNYTLTYGVDDQRRISVQTQGAASLTRYYLGDYEEETDQLGNVKKIHYLSGGAMLVNLNGVETLYYGYTDNQGSLIALTDASGNLVEKYAYDPWGARRNPNDWTQKDSRTAWITNRGYTGHEHLDAFGIINMNGRVYDPLTAMFFSPDPFIQTPGDWRNYNRYSYCTNNPTRYTDPSGYIKCYIEAPVFSDYASNWMSAGSGGGSGSALAVWDAQHRGSISYDNATQKFKYANGDEATIKEAFKKGERYSTYGFEHLCMMMSDGKLILAGSNGGEITGIKNGSFETTSKNTIACQLSPTLFQMAYADDWNSGSGESGSYLGNGLINHATNPAVDFFVGATEYKIGQILSNRSVYGKLLPETVIRTSLANINVSTKFLQTTGTVLKGTGFAFGVLGMVGTVAQYQTGQISGAEASLDLVMGGVGFIPGWGWAASGAYFLIAKPLYNYATEE